MKKTRYNEEQIVRILRETDRDTIAEVAKRHGISESSIYGWQKRFGKEASMIAAVKSLSGLYPRYGARRIRVFLGALDYGLKRGP